MSGIAMLQSVVFPGVNMYSTGQPREPAAAWTFVKNQPLDFSTVCGRCPLSDSRMLMSSHYSAVNHEPFSVSVYSKGVEDHLPHAFLGPTAESFVN